MKSVFILHHSYELDGHEQTKLIGAYSSNWQAEQAIARLKDKNGFKYTPDAFEITEYELDQDNWTEGFATVTSIQVKRDDNSWKTVQAECLPGNRYQIHDLYLDDTLLEFKHLDMVECQERDNILYAVKLVSKPE